jgi:hypothetical protein
MTDVNPTPRAAQPSSPSLRLLFGHQSVGGNLLEGLRELRASGAEVPEVVSMGASVPAAPSLIAEFAVGSNGDPRAKLEHFISTVNSPSASGFGAALFKFCYVDITDAAKADALFAEYTERMDELQRQRPDIVIAHTTVPLRTIPGGIGWAVRRLLGKRPPQIAHNAARDTFNKLLLARYGASGRVFDLASVEARAAEGSCAPGRQLFAGYTNDGGHLNAQGRRAAAEAFVQFFKRLASLNASGNAQRPRAAAS